MTSRAEAPEPSALGVVVPEPAGHVRARRTRGDAGAVEVPSASLDRRLVQATSATSVPADEQCETSVRDRSTRADDPCRARCIDRDAHRLGAAWILALPTTRPDVRSVHREPAEPAGGGGRLPSDVLAVDAGGDHHGRTSDRDRDGCFDAGHPRAADPIAPEDAPTRRELPEHGRSPG